MSMQRFNIGKPAISLVPSSYFAILALLQDTPVHMIEDVARVLEYGSRQYSRENWRKGAPWCEVLDCAMRHALKLMRGETHDLESGLHHIAHVSCNLAFLFEFHCREVGEDNRFRLPDAHLPYVTDDPLLHTMALMLAWRDGAGIEFLISAACTIASYYETLPETERAAVAGTSPHAFNRMQLN